MSNGITIQITAGGMEESLIVSGLQMGASHTPVVKEARMMRELIERLNAAGKAKCETCGNDGTLAALDVSVHLTDECVLTCDHCDAQNVVDMDSDADKADDANAPPAAHITNSVLTNFKIMNNIARESSSAVAHIDNSTEKLSSAMFGNFVACISAITGLARRIEALEGGDK